MTPDWAKTQSFEEWRDQPRQDFAGCNERQNAARTFIVSARAEC